MSDKISGWLSAPNASTNYKKALGQRQKGSGLWFLCSEVYSNWKTCPNSFLWLYGMPGCGKTILSSAIIKDLQDNGAHGQVLVYFYFDFNDTNKQSLGNMARTLISQIYYSCEASREHLRSLFSSCKDGNEQPDLSSILHTLKTMICQANEATVVLDALDESNNREAVLEWVQELLNAKHKLHILVTSRKEEDIESMIRERHSDEETVAIKGNGVAGDIRAYIHTRVRSHKDLKRWASRPAVQEKIETKLMEKADGM